MAISPALPGVSIRIFIDNQPLPEREMPDPDPQVRTVNVLVEAQTDKIFEIRIATEANAVFKDDAFQFKTYVDGNRTDAYAISRRESPTTVICDGLSVAKDQVRKYQFANIQTVERFSHSISSRSRAVRRASNLPSSNGLSVGNNSQVLYTGSPTVSNSQYMEGEVSELGTIKVKVRHGNKGTKGEFPTDICREREIVALGTSRASVDRGNTHYVSLTEPVATEGCDWIEFTKTPDVPRPAATFIFHYRSAKGLNSMQAAVDAVLPYRLRPRQPAPSETAQIEKDNALPIRKKRA